MQEIPRKLKSFLSILVALNLLFVGFIIYLLCFKQSNSLQLDSLIANNKIMESESQITKIKTVKIFKTNVRNYKDVANIVTSLLIIYPSYKINFDLADGDNILRIEANQCEIDTDQIMQYMVSIGYSCEGIE